MLTPALHRLTTWLCLVTALFMGVAPAQGFVLCVEQDGCVSVEVTAAADHCAGCEGHVSTGVDSASATPATAATRCPCIDLAVPGSTKEKSLQPKSPHAPLLKWLALLPTSMAPPIASTPLVLIARRIDAPRPLDSLRLIRSVVLLV